MTFCDGENSIVLRGICYTFFKIKKSLEIYEIRKFCNKKNSTITDFYGNFYKESSLIISHLYFLYYDFQIKFHNLYFGKIKLFEI